MITNTHRKLASLGAILAFGIPFAPSASAQAPTFSAKSIHDEIAYLASDKLKGRDTGEPGNDDAARFIAQEFARSGLKPIGTSQQKSASAAINASGFYQPFTFLAGHKVGTHSTLEYTAKGMKTAGQAGVDFIPAGISGHGAASGDVVFAGYGIHAPSIGHDDFAGVDVKGKVLLILSGAPTENPHEPAYAYGSLFRKASAAFDLGVKAILVFDPKEPELKAARFEYRQNDDSAVPVLRLSKAYAEAMLNNAAANGFAEAAQRGKIGATSLGIQVKLNADIQKITKTTANIAGIVEGSDPALKDQVVVIGGHMDHLGMGSPYSLSKEEGPAVHHGADDNASGATGVVELARYFGHGGKPGGPRPKRTLLFICFTGEELGLYGSEWYVKHPILPLEKTAAMLNMDMIGRLREDKLTLIGIESAPNFNAMVAEQNAGVGLNIAKSGGDFGGGSDHESFDNHQIPVLFFFTGTHADYHTPTDTVDKINCEGEAKVLALVAKCAETIADTPERPVYHKAEKATQSRGGFGVYFGSVPDYAAQVEGVQLNAVRAGSPAAKAGLQPGDIIVKFGDRTVRNVNDYTYALQDHKPGDVVELRIKRGSETLTVKATLAARPQQ